MKINEINNEIIVTDFGGINLRETLFCGQAFRWNEMDDGRFYGITRNVQAFVSQKNENELRFSGVSRENVEKLWLHYFDLDRDYPSILKKITADGVVASAVNETGTLRILNQEPWECLCSFIISACNNIPRIRKIVATLCENFGEKIADGYTFPTAEKVASLSEDDLAVLHAGYRVPYILDAAKKVASEEINLTEIMTLSPETAEKTLMKINGVGKKVADCTMLYSLEFFDTYPIDRHIARANGEFYPDGLPECFDGAKGLAQQYIFLRKM